MKVLGVETSCDETAVAIIENGDTILSNVVLSQIDTHTEYGGVVPEIAARSHLEAMNAVIDQAMSESCLGWEDIDAISVAYGAGLSGSLLIGVTAARVLAVTKNKPLYACNHVIGHVFASFITEGPEGINYPAKQPIFPVLGLIVSGKHSQLVFFRSRTDYDVLGVVQDDAIGEAFDKVAKLLGLPYPGGPSIAKAAESGDPHAYSLPKPKVPGQYDFSFSGLKTAVLRLAQAEAGSDYTLPSFEVAARLSEAQKANIAASFQRTAVEMVVDKTLEAYEELNPASVVIAGGVAASSELRRQLNERLPIQTDFTPPQLCTDNGAMIGCLGCHMIEDGAEPVDPYTLGVEPSLKM